MPKIYRVMLKVEGKPAVGDTANRLGARPQIDIRSDQNGHVRPETGGMSVSPGLNAVPTRLVPERLRSIVAGARGKNEHSIWSMGSGAFFFGEVAFRLILRLDPENNKHGFVEPAALMPFDNYQNALAATQDAWREDETVEHDLDGGNK